MQKATSSDANAAANWTQPRMASEVPSMLCISMINLVPEGWDRRLSRKDIFRCLHFSDYPRRWLQVAAAIEFEFLEFIYRDVGQYVMGGIVKCRIPTWSAVVLHHKVCLRYGVLVGTNRCALRNGDSRVRLRSTIWTSEATWRSYLAARSLLVVFRIDRS